MLAWVSSPQGTPSDQSKCAPSLGRLTRRNQSLTDIFQEFQVQVQQKESGLSRRKVASFIEGWLAGRLCEPYLPTKPNGRGACAPHFLTDQRMSRMVQKVTHPPALGIWLIKPYFGLRPSSLQTALWDITQHFMLAWVSSPQGTPSDQSKCAPSLGRLTRRNQSLTDIFQEFQVQVQQKESGLSRRKVASFIEGWLAGRLCEPYLPTKPNGRGACAPHFLTDQRMSRMVQKVSCDISRYRLKNCKSSPCDPRDCEFMN